MDLSHAYNYWRAVFVSEADGSFSKADFDEWFRAGANEVEGYIDFFGVVDNPGSDEHFNVVMRTALVRMLSACARGEFGK